MAIAKESIDLDTNFNYFILILAMMLLSAITGARISEMKYQNGSFLEIMWLIIFIMLMMGVFSMAIFYPYAYFRVGTSAILLGSIAIIVKTVLFFVQGDTFFDVGIGIIIAEVIAIGLIIFVGILFIMKGMRKDMIKNEYHKAKAGIL